MITEAEKKVRMLAQILNVEVKLTSAESGYPIELHSSNNNTWLISERWPSSRKQFNACVYSDWEKALIGLFSLHHK